MKAKLLIVVFVMIMNLFAYNCTGLSEENAAITEEELFSFYQGNAFVGDSITRQLRIYMNEKKQRGENVPELTFLTAQSYLLYTASRKNLLKGHTNILYKGEEMPLCRIIGKMKPERVFILLGVNDYAGKDIKKHIGYVERLIMLLNEFSEGTEIYFFSLTPVTPAFCKKSDYRSMWDNYNVALQKTCQENGAQYIDIATPLKDEEGYLRKEYCSDGQYHLSSEGLQVWLDTMLAYAQEKYDAGEWKLVEE